MIIVKIKSEIMDAERVFKSNSGTIGYLKKVKKLHATHSKHYAGAKPLRRHFLYPIAFKKALADWQMRITPVSLKVEIKNTEDKQFKIAV